MDYLRCWGTSGYLPYGGFKWLKNVDDSELNSVSENNSTGYILEVDLEYPAELHVLHNDYPLAPEKPAIRYHMLSDYCKKVAYKYGIKVDDVMKLILNLGDKTNYVLHYRNLQLYFSLGMKLTKFHKVLTFTQSVWMKKSIDFNNGKRTNAANRLKYFFKFMINSVFHKTMEKLQKITNVRLANN